jgi:PEP-CTERM motif
MTRSINHILGGAFALAATIIVTPALAATVLTFEGLSNLEPVDGFYNGANGGLGSGSGPNFGITFSQNALAIIDSDAGGTGNIGGEPSPSTVLFFLTGDAATMNVAGGFDTGFSFFYSAIVDPGSINVWDGLDGTGNLLATLALALTPFNGAPDPTGAFSPLVPVGVAFDGIARSVDFGGTVDRIAFDDITIGSVTPGANTSVPEPGSLILLAAGALGAGFIRQWTRRR